MIEIRKYIQCSWLGIQFCKYVFYEENKLNTKNDQELKIILKNICQNVQEALKINDL